MPRIITAQIPPGSRGGAAVDLGAVQLETRGDRRLTILSADGKPAETESVRVIRDGILRRLYPTEDDVYDPLLVPFASGDEVIATARWSEDEILLRTIRMTLEGPGPWTLRGDEGNTSLAVDARDLARSAPYCGCRQEPQDEALPHRAEGGRAQDHHGASPAVPSRRVACPPRPTAVPGSSLCRNRLNRIRPHRELPGHDARILQPHPPDDLRRLV